MDVKKRKTMSELLAEREAELIKKAKGIVEPLYTILEETAKESYDLKKLRTVMVSLKNGKMEVFSKGCCMYDVFYDPLLPEYILVEIDLLFTELGYNEEEYKRLDTKNIINKHYFLD